MTNRRVHVLNSFMSQIDTHTHKHMTDKKILKYTHTHRVRCAAHDVCEYIWEFLKYIHTEKILKYIHMYV